MNTYKYKIDYNFGLWLIIYFMSVKGKQNSETTEWAIAMYYNYFLWFINRTPTPAS